MPPKQSVRMATSQRKRVLDSDTEEDNDQVEDYLKCASVYMLAVESHPSYTKDLELKKRLDIQDNTQFKRLMQDVYESFRDELGMNLIHMEGKTFTVTGIEKLPSDLVLNTIESEKHGLLAVVLTLIFMYENNTPSRLVTEEKLWEYLGSFGLSDINSDEVFGDAKKLLGRTTGEFIHNGWLHVRKAKIEEQDEHIYEWGPRALACVDPIKLLKWHCDIDGSDPKDWDIHYAKAKEMRKSMQEIHKSGRDKYSIE